MAPGAVGLVCCLVPLALLAACHAWAGEDISREALQRAVNATVFIRSERIFKYDEFPASGSGFFIHPDGYLLTNWHVVSDQVSTEVWGRKHEVSAKVVSLTAVVASGTPRERELEARIVARDRVRDLALLRLDCRPEAWLDPDDLAEVDLADKVWTVGFPFGELLALEKQEGAAERVNPEVSLSAGMVTSLRHDAEGRLKAIQTDAAVNPGSSGGPMVDAQGRLAGVVYAMIAGGQGVGFGVAGPQVREFISAQAIAVAIDPKVILEPPSPITVSVSPILADLSGRAGEVRLEGSDIAPLAVPLEPSGNGLAATVAVPARLDGRPRANQYSLTVAITARDDRAALVRSFRLDAVPTSMVSLGSARDPALIMEDRKVFSHELDLEDHTRSQPVEEGAPSPRSLSDLARSTQLQRDAQGRLVIDNHVVEELGQPALDPKLFRFIRDPDLRQAVQLYHRLLREARQLEQSLRHARQGKAEGVAAQTVIDLENRLWEVARVLEPLSFELYDLGVYRCAEDGTYFLPYLMPREAWPCQRVLSLEVY